MFINSNASPYRGNVMIIYKTVNVLNGKFYVGQDSKNNPEYLGSGTVLKRAIEKHGRNNFIKETLEVCSTQEELNEREKYWIKETKAQELGYNIAEGGQGGNTYSEETKQKVSEFFKGRYVSPETVEKRKETRKKREQENPDRYKQTEERKKAIGDFHRGKEISEEQRQKNSERMKNFTNYSPEFLEMQNGENRRGEKSPMWGTKASEETRKKQSEAHKKNPVRYWLGKEQSEEHIRKRTERQKGSKWSEERRKKYEENGNPFRGQSHTPEAREKIRQGRLNKTAEEMLEIYIKFHITRKGYEPSEEQKQKKLEEYKKKRS
jgi:group I intron endonuclease